MMHPLTSFHARRKQDSGGTKRASSDSSTPYHSWVVCRPCARALSGHFLRGTWQHRVLVVLLPASRTRRDDDPGLENVLQKFRSRHGRMIAVWPGHFHLFFLASGVAYTPIAKRQLPFKTWLIARVFFFVFQANVYGMFSSNSVNHEYSSLCPTR